MKIERSKEWWMARARREGDAAVGAGLLAFDPAPDERPATIAQTAAAEETRIAFGKFVNLMRRRRGLSMERLAEVAELDASELLVIENEVHYVPEPRTIFKLAQTFEVSQRRLMQLAGLAAANDAGLRQEAVRFAARSEAMHKLTPEENSALEAFVAVLSEQDPKRAK
ncbi:helix-turn-helix transcriptional regulator [Bradyrhizobium sp.]|jgi:transcriptional regulator with XRE-family HTH domain|uniref:helix-turn-helix domain-containing protein n=1 Tax=Bradyrhizobium sp. TaxID=376 RepID=UPI002DDD8E89|nr:helix-turn-helix transcriptional regulator [Bradyrhizobium sp.]HEV2160450.1 helix-turn-helix transcriptional regulator [Bradyrhizobium sp.]